MNKKTIYILCVIIFVVLLILATVILNNKNVTGLLKVNQEGNREKAKQEFIIDVNNEISEEEMLNGNEKEEEENHTTIIVVNDETFEKEVLKNEKPVLVDFYASWCPPCKKLLPIIEEIAKERNNIKVVKVNIDDSADITQQYKVNAIPTLVLMKDGKEVNRITGLVGKEVLENMITNN